MLNGGAIEINGVGFAGAKGFGGGFGRATLSAWDESPIKAFVGAAIDEVHTLESVLRQLHNGASSWLAAPGRAVAAQCPMRRTMELSSSLIRRLVAAPRRLVK